MITIPNDIMRAGIRLTAFSAATDESRPVLTGILLHLEENRITMASADGFRLSVYSNELPLELSEPIKVIVPARSMQELERLLAQQTTPLKLHISDNRNQAMFKLDNIEMVSQLIRGEFPDYRQLIPDAHDTMVTVDIDQLKRAVQAAGVFARDGSNIIRMEFEPMGDGEYTPSPDNPDHTPGRLTVSARSEEVGSSTDLVDLDDIQGDQNKIAFNVRYLTDAINIMDKGKAAIYVNSPSNPGVIKMVDNETWTHVAMPVCAGWTLWNRRIWKRPAEYPRWHGVEGP